MKTHLLIRGEGVVCGARRIYGMWLSPNERGTLDADEVTCPTCQEIMAGRVSQALEEDDPSDGQATGVDLDSLASNWGVNRMRGETDKQLRARIHRDLGIK